MYGSSPRRLSVGCPETRPAESAVQLSGAGATGQKIDLGDCASPQVKARRAKRRMLHQLLRHEPDHSAALDAYMGPYRPIQSAYPHAVHIHHFDRAVRLHHRV